MTLVARTLKSLCAFGCACALCFTLTACGGQDADSSSGAQSASAAAGSSAAGAADTAVDLAPFVGTWKTAGISDGQDVLLVKDADESIRESVTYTLVLEDDGTAQMENANGTLTGSWIVTSDATISVSFNPTAQFSDIPVYDLTLEDGSLAMAEPETNLVMIFEKE